MAAISANIIEYLFLGLSSLSTTTVVLMAIAAAAVAYYKYQNTCSDDWTRYGVKCPKLPRFYFFTADFRSRFTELLTQYGDIIGLNGGPRLVMITTNFDLMRHILIKDFNNFVDRSDAFLSSSPFPKSLFFARGAEWRRHRQIVSPTFSTGKLKYISKSVDQSARDLCAYLKEFAKDSKLVAIKEVAARYTCEIIAKTAFGLDAKFIDHEDDEFYNYAKNMLRLNPRTGIWRKIFMLLSTIPHLRQLSINVFKMQYFDPVDLTANKYFGVTLKNTVAERRQQQVKGQKRSRVDFLDLLLKASDAASSGKFEASDDDFYENQEWKPVDGLSEEEIIGHSMLIIFAGMETTATTLQMCLYELAANLDIQEKVFQEITAVVKGESPTSEELNSLPYTEQVINETLRMYPPVPSVNRMAKETRTYSGVTIPKGSVVNIPYFNILSDPKIFPEPTKFDPDRFSPSEKEKRDSLAFSAFGHGPRLCLGMRLAYLELKEALVHVLRELKVSVNEKTEPKKGSEGVIFNKSRELLTPIKPIMLAFEIRDTSVRKQI